MHRDLFGRVVVEQKDLIQQLYRDPDFDISQVPVDQLTQKMYNRSLEELHIKWEPLRANDVLPEDWTIEDFDRHNQERWCMPEHYQNLDVWEYLAKKISESSEQGLYDPERLDRVLKEMNMFEERGLIPLLRYLIYFVETMRENRVLMGVGRGSSVSSYVLYLIGVHRIDSFKYNLDIHEFLK